jgi:para-nitrobenzyl esterase
MSRKGFVVILWMLCAVLSIAHQETTARAQGQPCLVTTSLGDVAGSDRGEVCEFRGVRFAQPPVGALRWRPPAAAAAWSPAVLDATVAAPVCPQFNMAGAAVGNENCLTMNIWAPHPGTRGPLPVIVWLHAGSFQAASANLAAHNAARFVAEEDAVVVAPNYRLGPLGFLAHGAFRGENVDYPTAGNYGLLDQRFALEWVRTHISAFGGDPSRITIAGQSAGGLSVSLHLVSPGSYAVFDRAIVQGGLASYRWRTGEDGQTQANAFATALGCSGAVDVPACLRTKTALQVLQALPVGTEQFAETSRTQWGPVVDGLVIPDQPRTLFEAGAFNRVPTIIGSNDDEGWTWVSRSFSDAMTSDEYALALTTEFGPDAPAILAEYPVEHYASPREALARAVTDAEYACGAERVSRLIERTGTRVYLYQFAYGVEPVASARSVHGLDVHLLFGTNVAPPVGTYALNEDGDAELFRTMAGYWTRLAATGNPNDGDVAPVHWPVFNRPTGDGRGADRYLILDETLKSGKRLREAHCAFWEPYFFRSITGAVPASAP